MNRSSPLLVGMDRGCVKKSKVSGSVADHVRGATTYSPVLDRFRMTGNSEPGTRAATPSDHNKRNSDRQIRLSFVSADGCDSRTSFVDEHVQS